MKNSLSFNKLIFVVVILTSLVGYSYINAQWTPPTSSAPDENVDAPINVSAYYQFKPGDLGAVRMRAGQYCDETGLVCFEAKDISGTTPAPVNCKLVDKSQRSCGAFSQSYGVPQCPSGSIQVGPIYTVGRCTTNTDSQVRPCMAVTCTN